MEVDAQLGLEYLPELSRGKCGGCGGCLPEETRLGEGRSTNHYVKKNYDSNKKKVHYFAKSKQSAKLCGDCCTVCFCATGPH